VALARTDFSKQRIICIIRVKRISKQKTLSVTTITVTANVDRSVLITVTLMMEGRSSSETSVLPIATRRHISEDGIHCFVAVVPTEHIHCR
jgi:hypothetical protein